MKILLIFIPQDVNMFIWICYSLKYLIGYRIRTEKCLTASRRTEYLHILHKLFNSGAYPLLSTFGAKTLFPISQRNGFLHIFHSGEGG
uniref:Uncharacterized protein n=1 Tax=Lepeophtheirus salmonis TaxID=72036 RepID=A0A0K2TXA3_LEPSM